MKTEAVEEEEKEKKTNLTPFNRSPYHLHFSLIYLMHVNFLVYSLAPHHYVAGVRTAINAIIMDGQQQHHTGHN